MTGRELAIGALSTRTGVHIETIRYYERIGILPPPPRTSGNHRLYGAEHLKRLEFIRRSRELGFTLDEIRTLLGLVRGDAYTCAEVRDVALDHLARIRTRITDLQRMEDTLEATIARCDGSDTPDCPIVDALFESAPGYREQGARRAGVRRGSAPSGDRGTAAARAGGRWRA